MRIEEHAQIYWKSFFQYARKANYLIYAVKYPLGYDRHDYLIPWPDQEPFHITGRADLPCTHQLVDDEGSFIKQLDTRFVHEAILPVRLQQNDPFLVEFFTQYYLSQDETSRKEMLKNIDSYTQKQWIKAFKSLLPTLCPHHITPIIHQIPVASWKATTIDLKSLDELLLSQNISSKDLDLFYIKFFKKRQAQIKQPQFGEPARDFLLDKYSGQHDALKPYFSFFPYVKTRFEEPSFDFFKVQQLHLTKLIINCHEAAKTVCIPQCDGARMKMLVKEFINDLCTAMKKDFGIDHFEVSYEAKSPMMMISIQSHQPVGQDYLGKLLTAMMKLKQQGLPGSVDQVVSFVMQQKLEQNLEAKTHGKPRSKI